MTEYDFTIKFDISGSDNMDMVVLTDKLYGAGCDDAIIGTGRTGQIALNFIREAESAEKALSSAINNVLTAIPNARLIEAYPDYVGLTDIADIIGCTRQNIQKVHARYRSSFPLPVHDGKTTIWHLAKILPWFKGKNYKILDSLLEISKANMKLNSDRQKTEVF